jgi:hypothetical protein
LSLGDWNRTLGTTSTNIGGSSRLINIGTNSSISDLNIVPNDNAVRFDTFVLQLQIQSGNNANGVITLQQIMVRSMVRNCFFVDNDDFILKIQVVLLQNGGRLFIQVT